MFKLLKHIREYTAQCILAPLFKMLEALFELFVPLAIAAIIDKGIGTGSTDEIIKYSIVLVGLGVIGLIFSVIAQYSAAKAATGFSAKIRHLLFEHIGTLGYSEIDSLGASTLITRMTGDINQVQNGVNLTLRLLLRSPFVVFGAMIMAFTINTRAAMIFLWVTVILLVVVFAIMLISTPLYKKTQQKLDSITGLARENFTGTRVIRAFCMEEAEAEEFTQRSLALTKMQKLAGKVTALMNPVTYMIINAAVIVLIFSGSNMVNDDILTKGSLVALYNYMSQILVELIKLANLIISITRSIACGNRIQAVLDTTPSMIKGSRPVGSDEFAAEFNNVSLTYESASESSLSDIDFRVKAGEVTGIIGGTGSGKSSLVNLIPRFYDATEGTVRVFGTDVKEADTEKLRNIVGIVPQKAVLFRGTIRDNLKWGNENASDEELLEAVKAAQAEDVVKAKGGLDAVIEAGGRNLSGGQRQRLTIARALVRKPKILILDDSSSALDQATDAALRRSLSSLAFNPTVFIVSQRISSVCGADRIIVLDDGEIAGCGTHSELLESCGVYQEIFSSQSGKEEE